MKQHRPGFLAGDDGSSVGVEVLAAYNGALDRIVAIDRRIAALHAERIRALDEAHRLTRSLDFSAPDARPQRRHDPDVTERAFIADVATATRTPERTTVTAVATAERLLGVFSDTLAALSAGRISLRHATAIVEETWGLGDEAARRIESDVLPEAAELTPGRFHALVRRTREKAHPESISQRRADAVGDRETTFEAARDGMAFLHAYLPAEEALAVWNRVNEVAMSLQASGEQRTLAQLRADVLRDLALATGAGAPTIVANVRLLVPALTALGQSEEPASLEGYGPIDPATALRLARGSTAWHRILTHPVTGAIVAYDRQRYKPPPDLDRLIRLRDGTCRFPGCTRDAAFTEIDHTVARADDGPTNDDNLAALCPRHHALKHDSTWQVVQRPDGGELSNGGHRRAAST